MGWADEPQEKIRENRAVAHLKALDFARTVQEVCHHAALVLSYDVQILDDLVVKMRVTLVEAGFIDVFYNADSGKCAYALIREGNRVFGADNAFIGWHIHPFDAPEQHVISAEVSFAEFLRAVEERVGQNKLG